MSECSDNSTCARDFEDIHRKLDQLDEAIRGNGKPGIQIRLDRLENAEATRSKLLWIIAAATVTLAAGNLWRFLAGA